MQKLFIKYFYPYMFRPLIILTSLIRRLRRYISNFFTFKRQTITTLYEEYQNKEVDKILVDKDEFEQMKQTINDLKVEKQATLENQKNYEVLDILPSYQYNPTLHIDCAKEIIAQKENSIEMLINKLEKMEIAERKVEKQFKVLKCDLEENKEKVDVIKGLANERIKVLMAENDLLRKLLENEKKKCEDLEKRIKELEILIEVLSDESLLKNIDEVDKKSVDKEM